MKNDPCFAIIAFGKLGQSAEISLLSMLSVGARRICVSGDPAGLSWVEATIPEDSKDILCKHIIPTNELAKLGLISKDEVNYSNFGEKRFISLTTFKWFLLKNVLEEHKNITKVYFSDLDVYWLQKPKIEFLNSTSDRTVLAQVQDDTPKNSTSTHFCTGIMVWRNCPESITVLNELYVRQLSYNTNGNLIPDEPTFNIWQKENSGFHEIGVLDRNCFVIGHRFFLIGLSPINRIIAFHANYVIGEDLKLRRLMTIKFIKENNLLWIILYSYEICIKAFQKLSQSLKTKVK